MAILAPADEAECRALLQTAYEHTGPALVRYPRGSGPGTEPTADLSMLPWGQGEIRRSGTDVAILSFGALLDRALDLGDQLEATVANMRFVKPLDEALINQLAAEHRVLVTLEENVVAGGAGSAVNELLLAAGYTGRVLNYGLPDQFIEQATQQEQLEQAGLGVETLLAGIQQVLTESSAG